ncbi:hypothetical protein SLEP1_g56551 [Rubroshorea leprosula]|uniref:Uncharacterized protein n=1 Tax=Rubroshorea leprosula TaxID=152421 RepID=A0AAV5MJ30_9ROSI|nr:hypothetical protein SLEP1_g56551 [Rubroshorea leprosula]
MEDFSCVKKTEGEIPHSQVPEKIVPNFEIDSSSSSGSRPNICLEPSENTDRYLDGAQPLEREYAQPAIPGTDLAPTQSDEGKSDNHAEAPVYSLASIEELLEDDSYKSFSFFLPPNTVDELLSVDFDKGKSEDTDRVKEAQVACPYSQGQESDEIDVSSIPSEGKLDIQVINAAENYSDSDEANYLRRFIKILCSGSSATNPVTSSLEDASQLSSKISSLLEEDNKELDQMLKTGSGMEFSVEKLKDQLLQKQLKEKLLVWILQKDAEGGKGCSILDEDGQGVLHLAAALGYDWALEPTIVAGVSVDFRDVNRWTALHWAAFCGRENTVATLISLGADPGALTKRSPEYLGGRTPADLASANGHKRIAVYLGKPLGVSLSCTAAICEDLPRETLVLPREVWQREAELLRREEEALQRGYELWPFLKAQNQSKKMKEDEDEDEGPDDEGPEGRGPEKDEGPEKEKEEGKKRAPDSAWESGKANKILKAHLAYMALLTAYYVVQSMETIHMIVLVCVEASKKTEERKLSYIDDGFELSAIRE